MSRPGKECHSDGASGTSCSAIQTVSAPTSRSGVRIIRQSSRVSCNAAQKPASIATPRRNGNDAKSLRDPPPSRKTNIRNNIGAHALKASRFDSGGVGFVCFLVIPSVSTNERLEHRKVRPPPAAPLRLLAPPIQVFDKSVAGPPGPGNEMRLFLRPRSTRRYRPQRGTSDALRPVPKPPTGRF